MPDAATAPETVILADGEYPAEGIPAALLAQARYVVCCDGAADAYTAHGGIPSAIVGDGDSISRTTAQRFRDILHIVPDQETNDLTKAFSFCMEQGRRGAHHTRCHRRPRRPCDRQHRPAGRLCPAGRRTNGDPPTVSSMPWKVRRPSTACPGSRSPFSPSYRAHASPSGACATLPPQRDSVRGGAVR